CRCPRKIASTRLNECQCAATPSAGCARRHRSAPTDDSRPTRPSAIARAGAPLPRSWGAGPPALGTAPLTFRRASGSHRIITVDRERPATHLVPENPAMALTPSTMLALGTMAPEFSLPDPSDGKVWTLDDVARGKEIVTVWFLCNHCPYVKHVR